MTDTASTPPARYAHDLPFGAACLGPDRTRFRLWAPDAVEVWLDIDQGETVRMAAEPDGWYAAVVPVGAGTCYRYRVTNRAGATWRCRTRPRARSGRTCTARAWWWTRCAMRGSTPAGWVGPGTRRCCTNCTSARWAASTPCARACPNWRAWASPPWS